MRITDTSWGGWRRVSSNHTQLGSKRAKEARIWAAALLAFMLMCSFSKSWIVCSQRFPSSCGDEEAFRVSIRHSQPPSSSFRQVSVTIDFNCLCVGFSPSVWTSRGVMLVIKVSVGTVVIVLVGSSELDASWYPKLLLLAFSMTAVSAISMSSKVYLFLVYHIP
jgi:hypothetical protein